MEIVRTQTYAKALKRLRKLGASDADIETIELSIASDPKSGDMISGTGGLRKVRFAYARGGKRGGGRTIYYAWTSSGAVILITAYPKVDKDDLTADEKKMFTNLIKELTGDEEDQPRR